MNNQQKETILEGNQSENIEVNQNQREEGKSFSDHANEIQEGKWSQEQNETFIFFMDYYKSIFCNKMRRKKSKIYTYFADFIKSRNARQSRSRYQKIISYFNSFTRAKKHYINLLGLEVYQQKFQRFIKKLQSQPNFLKIKRPVYGRPKKQKPLPPVKQEQVFELPSIILPSGQIPIPKIEQQYQNLEWKVESPVQKEYYQTQRMEYPAQINQRVDYQQLPFFYTYISQFSVSNCVMPSFDQCITVKTEYLPVKTQCIPVKAEFVPVKIQ